MESTKVKVKSLVKHPVGLFLKERNFSRSFENEGAEKTIDMEIMEELMNDYGARTLFEEGFLAFEDPSMYEVFGMEGVRLFTSQDILDILNGPTDVLIDTLNTIRFNQRLNFVDMAVDNRITAYPVVQALKKFTGSDVMSIINLEAPVKE